jgi:protein tyrosine phosphatase (PTP) superfamily phosphohydrolase (DUF442 family)
MHMFVRIALPTALAGLAVGCSTTDAPRPATGGPVAPRDAHAIHNVHALDDHIISGAVPEGDAAFDELKALGVKTIISVDGATPDVDRAAARGIRYVHIPITYAEVTDEERLEIARAVRDLPGPVFIHCHHGKHRSPAAAAAVAITHGRITPEEGVAFMKTCGTAPNYTGLYATVAAAGPVAAAEIDAAPADFPAVRVPEGIVAAMVEADGVFEHLGDIRAVGWVVPPTHPDLVPAAEAGRLVDLLRVSGEDPGIKRHGDAYTKLLDEAVAAATALEDAVVAGTPAQQLETHYKLVQASCKDCHAVYRDK